MKPQFDNKVMSSFFLWFDNKILKKGEKKKRKEKHKKKERLKK